MMQIFNATVRLGGHTHHEVLKRGLTVPEIYVLRRIHGSDAVVHLEHVGYSEIDPADERERLDYEYKDGLSNLHDEQKTSIEKMLGSDFSPLPQELKDYDGPLNEHEDTLAEFQKPLPYCTPDAEARGATIRRKAAQKVAAKKESAKMFPAMKTNKKAALDAVL